MIEGGIKVMENKKGFTLVELLAVIAILAILMLLIMPNVLNMFQNGRKDAFITQVQSVWKTASTQYIASSISGSGSTSFCDNGHASIGCGTLDIGSTSVKYYVGIDGTGSISQIGVSDGNFCYVANTNPKLNITRQEVGDPDGKTLTCTKSGSTVTCTCAAS